MKEIAELYRQLNNWLEETAPIPLIGMYIQPDIIGDDVTLQFIFYFQGLKTFRVSIAYLISEIEESKLPLFDMIKIDFKDALNEMIKGAPDEV